jgi:hypothetical protein
MAMIGLPVLLVACEPGGMPIGPDAAMGGLRGAAAGGWLGAAPVGSSTDIASSALIGSSSSCGDRRQHI